MDYFAKGLFRLALFAFSILFCLGSHVRTADAASCTVPPGTVVTQTDILGNSCSATQTTASTATASAGGLDNTATSTATTDSTATSEAAGSDNNAASTATTDSTATANATGTGNAATSAATTDSTATSTASGGGNTATSTATTDGSATSSATGIDSTATATATDSTAIATAADAGTATSTDSTPGTTVCTFAGDASSTATGSDVNAPSCVGDDAVVVSPAGICGPVATSPCASFLPPASGAGIELQDYFSNANTTGGQGFVNITSPFEGNQTATNPVVQEGEMCAMIYVLNTDQAVEACCGCPITADGLLTLSISGNLAPNPVASGRILHDGSIRILSTAINSAITGLTLPRGVNCDAVTGACCDPTAEGGAKPLVPQLELAAWANHVQNTQITEAVFQTTPTPEAAGDLTSLPSACAFAVETGSGQGVCTCGTGGFGIE